MDWFLVIRSTDSSLSCLQAVSGSGVNLMDSFSLLGLVPAFVLFIFDFLLVLTYVSLLQCAAIC